MQCTQASCEAPCEDADRMVAAVTRLQGAWGGWARPGCIRSHIRGDGMCSRKEPRYTGGGLRKRASAPAGGAFPVHLQLTRQARHHPTILHVESAHRTLYSCDGSGSTS
jgi:hypothetical protein